MKDQYTHEPEGSRPIVPIPKFAQSSISAMWRTSKPRHQPFLIAKVNTIRCMPRDRNIFTGPVSPKAAEGAFCPCLQGAQKLCRANGGGRSCESRISLQE